MFNFQRFTDQLTEETRLLELGYKQTGVNKEGGGVTMATSRLLQWSTKNVIVLLCELLEPLLCTW
jgi:hypothetical protein